ncbi:permease [Jannaschia sp. M317]|uniref:permease n=1 Tax=Jannaschia sp. M317 TaxID=2867011 RepID=UPI0021A55487|nr:permease [Jannaschia sp. M317]UWQ17820.1 permease [Jannaschia sp. M317]
MTDFPLTRPPLWAQVTRHKVWFAIFGIFALLLVVNATQAGQSLRFVQEALWGTAPFLLASIGIAAWAKATGADGQIARAFGGAPLVAIAMAALAGALSPFCSCGVIPLIAALLTMGVPLSAVMAFWLASPLMDPSMFALTVGVLGLPFALAKTGTAVALGLFGGYVTHALMAARALPDPLRPEIGNGGCGGAAARQTKPIVWRFWDDPDRRSAFAVEARSSLLFLLKWLTLAFLLESLMLAFVPAETITTLLGGTGIGPIALATVVGVPAYLNGYAALPLVGGLIEQGMQPGAGLAFLIAGGVTSLPAAIAVWALVRPRVFGLYIVLSLTGAFAAGLAWQALG